LRGKKGALRLNVIFNTNISKFYIFHFCRCLQKGGNFLLEILSKACIAKNQKWDFWIESKIKIHGMAVSFINV
jgi:hypothetical protein